MVLVDQEQFLQIAQEKTRVINHLIDTKKVLIPRKDPQATIGRTLMNRWVKSIQLDGREHIQEGERLLAGKLTGTLNHDSDGDHRGIVHGLEYSGFPDFAQNICFKGGLKMYMRATRYFLGADPMIFTETPTELELRDFWRQQLGETVEFKAYEKAGGRLMRQSVVESVNWQKANKPLFIYPGATRQRGPEVISPPEKVSAFVKKGQWFLPIYSIGMEKILPQSKLPNIFDRTNLYIKAGECYKAEDVIELLKDPRLAGITAADVLMARITKLNPDARLSAEFGEKYSRLEMHDSYMQKAT